MTDTIRLGVLRLTDSAPAVLAEADGLFASEGVDVALQVEPSWANVADKLCWGNLAGDHVAAAGVRRCPGATWAAD